MTTATGVPVYYTTARGLFCALLGCPPDGHVAEINPATGELVEGHLVPTRSMTNAQANAYEADFARHNGALLPSPLPREPERGAPAAPSPVDPERARRHAEAVRYVNEYVGSWGLPLDIRARADWGTKYLRLSDRQIDALLAGRDRDRKRTEGWLKTTPRALDAVVWATTNRATNEFAASVMEGFERYGRMTDRQLEAILRKLDAPERKRVTEDGMYRMANGTIVKVQVAVNGSGNLYAKRLVPNGTSGTFEYAPGLITKLTPDDRMTVEEAAEFGKLYGFCCVCGRTLTDEGSIAAGIGPICAGRL